VWPLNKKEHLHKKKKSAKISTDATCGWYFFCGCVNRKEHLLE
jgi:hypothetical protein